jgi:outer membrane lipoprotein-sorting protein
LPAWEGVTMNNNDLPHDDLLQFLFGELDDARQPAVRKALAEDAELAAAAQGLATAVAAVRAENVGQVSDEFNDRLRRRMLEDSDCGPAEALCSVSRTRSLSNWRWIMRHPVSSATAAAIFVLALGGVALWFHGAGTAPAFADFVKPILEAKTAKFKMTTEMEMNGQAITATAEVMALGVTRSRQEIETAMPDKSKMKMVMIYDCGQGKSLTLEPTTKKAMVLTMTNMPKGKIPLDKDPLGWLRLLLLDARDKPAIKREPLGEKEIDGRRVVGFRVNTNGTVVSLWGDPKTGLPVRAEMTMAMFANAKMTLSDFVFNLDMDESLFSTEPPAGYTVQNMGNIDLSPAEEKDLIETFRECSQLKQRKQPLPMKDVYSPTGEDYHYEATDKGFILSSCGEDGIYGNGDDEMLIDGVGTGQRHEYYPLPEEKEGKALTEKAPGERARGTDSIKTKSAKTEDAADAPPLDPKIKELGEAVGKRLSTYSDEETLILKDGQTGRMKIKKNVTPVAEILITPHFVNSGTTFDLEGVDATGKAIEGTKGTSGTIHNAQTERNFLGKPFFVNGEGILSKIQLHPTRQDDNRVAVEVKVLFTGLPTPKEVEAMLLTKGKSGQLQKDFMAISRSLMEYKLRTGRYPKELAELSGGAFPDSLEMQAIMQIVAENFVPGMGSSPNEEQMRKMAEAQKKLQRGLMFALGLPPEADAHYAGKGVSLGAADKPIFWYRPKDAKKYRVIYADLSVRDADTPPNVPNAQPVPGPASPKK